MTGRRLLSHLLIPVLLAGCDGSGASDPQGDLPPSSSDTQDDSTNPGSDTLDDSAETAPDTLADTMPPPDGHGVDVSIVDADISDLMSDTPGDAYDTSDVDASDLADLVDLTDLADGDLADPGPDCSLDEAEIEPGSCPDLPEFFPGLPLDDFQELPKLPDELDGLQPSIPVTYWEWRFCFGGSQNCDVQASDGDKCAAASNPGACVEAFDALAEPSGFHESCLPGYCYEYLAVNSGDEVWTVTSAMELKALLAPLAGPLEVAALVYAAGYNIQGTLEGGGIRPVVDGWEVLVTKLTGYCDPIVTHRYLLHVATDGAITKLCSQIEAVLCGACI